MDIVADHETIVSDLLSFQTFLTDGSLANLSAENLSTNVVLTREHKLHLIENKVNLLLVLEGAVSLNGDLLDDLGSFIDFSISFVHLNELFGGLGVFAFEENFSLSRCAQSIQHGEALFA